MGKIDNRIRPTYDLGIGILIDFKIIMTKKFLWLIFSRK